MHRLVILVCAIAPSLALLQYGIAKARARWDDRVIWEAFFTGGVATIVVLLPELLLKKALQVDAMTPIHGALAEAFLVAAIPEELVKFGAIFYAIKRYGADEDGYDLITTSFAVALGFAAIENLTYLIVPGKWLPLAASRAALAVPMHGLDGLAMGLLLTLARLYPRQQWIWLMVALAVPIILHAGYDFPLMLVSRRETLVGVLPAWFVLVVVTSICILCLSNKVRVLAERILGPPGWAANHRPFGAVLLLLVPMLAGITLVGAGSFGIAGATALTVLPIILGVDLLFTSLKASAATATSQSSTESALG